MTEVTLKFCDPPKTKIQYSRETYISMLNDAGFSKKSKALFIKEAEKKGTIID